LYFGTYRLTVSNHIRSWCHLFLSTTISPDTTALLPSWVLHWTNFHVIALSASLLFLYTWPLYTASKLRMKLRLSSFCSHGFMPAVILEISHGFSLLGLWQSLEQSTEGLWNLPSNARRTCLHVTPPYAQYTKHYSLKAACPEQHLDVGLFCPHVPSSLPCDDASPLWTTQLIPLIAL
jgi:hypothetical protein